ncbi:MAG: amino acid permease [Myxococcota bacterium]
MKKLERRLGLTSVIAISIGAMLGSGLFVLPGLASALTGPSIFLAYAAAAVLVLPAALSKAELATAMPTSGGTYVYIDRAFGPLAGTIAGLGLWLSLLLKSAFALVGFGAYLAVLVDLPLTPTALALLALVVLLNVMGVKKVGRVQVGVVAIALVALTGLSLVGAPAVEARAFRPLFPAGGEGFLGAVAFVFISYAGVTKVAAVAEEVENPDRNLPRGILYSLGLVSLVYTGVTLVLVGRVPLEALQSDLRPIHTLAEAVFGPTLAAAFAVLGVITMTSMANAGLLASSRFPFAMARDQLLPGAFSWVQPRFLTPVTSIAVTALIMAAALVLFDVAKIAKLAGSFMIVAFVGVNLTVVLLRETDTQWYKPSFKTPWYPWMQLLGTLGGVALLVQLGLLALAAMAVMVFLGAAVFFAYGRRRTARVGLLGRLGPRKELFTQPPPEDDLRTALGEAAVVVALLGEERSPEALVEMGGALAHGGKVEVLLVTGVPDQTDLESIEESPRARSLRRRVGAIADERGFDLSFEPVVTHDVVRTIHEVTSRVHCQWLVMEWHGEEAKGVTFFNPLGWLANHLDCNLAFVKDVGIRYTREILVLPDPGPHDVLVATTADHLATTLGARMTFARFIGESASQVTKDGVLGYLAELGDLCETEPELLTVSGPDESDEIIPLSVAYDLVIMGDRRGINLREKLFGNEVEQITRGAACSVLRLKTPRRKTHETLPPPRAPAPRATISVEELLDPRLVAARLPVSDKTRLFAHAALKLSEVVNVEPSAIEAALWKRERSQNTSVGHGVGLPHATLEQLDRTVLAVLTLEKPIAYGEKDEEPLDVFFVTAGPPEARNEHLELLSGLARLMQEGQLRERLRAARDEADILAAFRPEPAASPLLG